MEHGIKVKKNVSEVGRAHHAAPVPFAAALMAYNRKGERSQISGLTFNLVKPE